MVRCAGCTALWGWPGHYVKDRRHREHVKAVACSPGSEVTLFSLGWCFECHWQCQWETQAKWHGLALSRWDLGQPEAWLTLWNCHHKRLLTCLDWVEDLAPLPFIPQCCICPPPRADLLIMFFRCCGRRTSGPPAEPQGKEQMALATSSSDTWTGIGWSSVDTSGIVESWWGRGCFSRRVASISLLGTAILSSEEARWTAPLKSPSFSLAETLPAKVSTGSRMNLPVRLLGADWTMVGSACSLISWLVCEAKLLQWLPLSGTRRRQAGKQNRRSRLMRRDQGFWPIFSPTDHVRHEGLSSRSSPRTCVAWRPAQSPRCQGCYRADRCWRVRAAFENQDNDFTLGHECG